MHDWEMLVHLLATVSLRCESGSFRFLEYQRSSIVLFSSVSNQIDAYLQQLMEIHNEVDDDQRLFYLEMLFREQIIYLEHKVVKLAKESASKYAKIEQMTLMLAQKRYSDLDDNQTVVVTTSIVEKPKEVICYKFTFTAANF